MRTDFKNWNKEDYLFNFLSIAAARSRLSEDSFQMSKLTRNEIEILCAPVRRMIESRYVKESPEISIILRAYNEEKELLPTLVAYAFCCELPARTELIVVDNNSNDRTGLIADCCGVRRVICIQPGIGYATKSGYDSISDSSKYVLISDADVRPSKPFENEPKSAEFICTSYRYLESNLSAMGVSTGTKLEAAHWSYWLANAFARKMTQRQRNTSYWAGANQFIRRSALDAIGGIDPEIGYGCSEDHARRYALARWCRPQGFQLPDGAFTPDLVDPNYHSGRRHGTLSRVIRHIIYTLISKRHPIGDDGWPIFDKTNKTKKISVR